MLAKRTSKNQITIPKRVIERFPDTEYFDVCVENGNIVLKPVQTDRLEQIYQKLAQLDITEQDIRDAVAWARDKKPESRSR